MLLLPLLSRRSRSRGGGGRDGRADGGKRDAADGEQQPRQRSRRDDPSSLAQEQRAEAQGDERLERTDEDPAVRTAVVRKERVR